MFAVSSDYITWERKHADITHIKNKHVIKTIQAQRAVSFHINYAAALGITA